MQNGQLVHLLNVEWKCKCMMINRDQGFGQLAQTEKVCFGNPHIKFLSLELQLSNFKTLFIYFHPYCKQKGLLTLKVWHILSKHYLSLRNLISTQCGLLQRNGWKKNKQTNNSTKQSCATVSHLLKMEYK